MKRQKTKIFNFSGEITLFSNFYDDIVSSSNYRNDVHEFCLRNSCVKKRLNDYTDKKEKKKE